MEFFFSKNHFYMEERMSRIKEQVLQQGRYGVAKEFRGTENLSQQAHGDQALVHGGSRKTSVGDPKHKKDLRTFFNSPLPCRAVKVIYK